MKKVIKIRLLQDDKHYLRSRVAELVGQDTGGEVLKAREALRSKVSKMMGKFLPPETIKLMRKYDGVITDNGSVCITHPVYGRKLVHMETPWLCGGINDAQGNRLPHDAQFVKLYDKYIEEVGKENEKHREIKGSFYALIENARYFEDVVALWSDAEQYRTKMKRHLGCTTLSCVTESDKDNIKNYLNKDKK